MTLRGWLKVSALLFFVSLVYCGWTESAEVEVESRISEVTVYPDSALINRIASPRLKTGEHEIVFADVVAEVDENSLRVSALGEAEVKLFGAQLKREYLEETPAERIKQLQDEIRGLEDEVKAAQNLKSLLLEEKSFLDSIGLFSQGQISKDLITKLPTPEDLDKILKFLDIKLKENYSQVMEAELSIRDKQEKIEVLRRRLNQISGPVKKLKTSIVVELQILKAGDLDLSVSYIVRGASWRPVYDARASFEKREVELVSYGIVRQATGEDWEDVEISLSTAKPAIGGRMPYVAPWFLRPYQPRALDSVRRKAVAEAPMGMQYEAFEFEEGAGAPKVEYATAEEKGIAVVYKLTRKATVKSDGTEHKLPVSSQVLKAKFEYSTYPRASTFAYLGTRVTNSADLQLLAGRVNIFLEEDFVGSSSIDNIAPGEEFDLYLGVDENVRVKRESLERKVSETLIARYTFANQAHYFQI